MSGESGTILIGVGVVFLLVLIILVAVVVGTTVLGRRRYLRTREHLGARLLTAQDEERAAIARELHDDVVQKLIKSSADVRAAGLPAGADIAEYLDRVVDDLRQLARDMHPTATESVGLDAALRALCKSFGQREDMTCEYHGIDSTDDLLPKQRLALYRVAQEALGNVARHARVDHAVMTLTHNDTETRLVIEDTGAGFDSRHPPRSGGIGVTSMQERLSLLGGTFRIESAVGKGTRVEAVLRKLKASAKAD